MARKYGQAIVVFDGYDSERPSTKDMTHQKRAKGKYSPTVTFSEEMKVTYKKDHFLSNVKNKQRFINMLSRCLQEKNCQTIHAEEDADALIVQTAIESAKSLNTVLVGDDTDLLILLCHHASSDGKDLFFQPEAKARSSKNRTWNIKAVKQQLGYDLCQNILFLHAVGGCDTTSRPNKIGKAAPLKKYNTTKQFRDQTKVFDSPSASKSEIVTAGEKALVYLYGGKDNDRLDSLRYKRFCEKVATRTLHIEPQNLPPTAGATMYHSLRVYFQVQQWKGVRNLLPENWGWRVIDGKLLPIMTDLQPASEELLHIIRCNCATDCSSLKCTCRKSGIKCSSICGQCKGSGCTNSAQLILDDSDDDDSFSIF